MIVPETVHRQSSPLERLAWQQLPGSPDRAHVLFAHGFGQTRQAWTRSAETLAAHGHGSTRFDARGHGQSQWNSSNEPYELEQFVDDLTLLARALAAPPVLVGASMGGLLGLYAQAHRDPPPFQALVLVDIAPRWDDAGVERILDFMTAHPEGFDSPEHAIDVIAAYLPHRPRRKRVEELEPLLARRDDGRWRWHWDPRMIDGIGRRGGEYQSRLLDATDRIDVPTLLVSGGRSELIGQDHVAEFLQRVPHARHVCLPQATHMVVGDDNDAFTRTILDFMSSLPAGNALPAGAVP